MAAKDTEKSAIKTPIGNFYYTMMPFGLKMQTFIQMFFFLFWWVCRSKHRCTKLQSGKSIKLRPDFKGRGIRPQRWPASCSTSNPQLRSYLQSLPSAQMCHQGKGPYLHRISVVAPGFLTTSPVPKGIHVTTPILEGIKKVGATSSRPVIKEEKEEKEEE